MSLHVLVEKWRDAATEERDYYADALRDCADQLEAALAGGGEAVAYRWHFPHCQAGYFYGSALPEYTNDDLMRWGDPIIEPLFTRPAGAVQVDEAMIERALTALVFDGTTSLEYALECADYNKKDASWIVRTALGAALNPGGSRE